MAFLDDLRQLVDRHAPQVPELAARLARAGLAAGGTLGDHEVHRVPLLRKSALLALQRSAPPWGGMLSLGFQAEACFMSPGGLVEPLVPRMVERLAELLQSAGFGPQHRVLNGFGYHFTPAGLLFHGALVRAGCTVLPGGPQNTAAQIEFAMALGANAFVGIASHLKILFDGEPALPIRLAMAGAEPHGGAVREELRTRHGVRCIDMYGFAEAGIVAASCPEAGALHLHADVLAEVVEPVAGTAVAEGEPGELVVSLDNPGFPLLRLATGDLVRIEPSRCACGRLGALQVLGRADQSARVKGMLLYPSQLQAFAEAAGVRACRLAVSRVEGRDRLTVSLRAHDGLPEEGLLQSAFVRACRLKADAFVRDDALPEAACSIEDLRVG